MEITFIVALALFLACVGCLMAEYFYHKAAGVYLFPENLTNAFVFVGYTALITTINMGVATSWGGLFS